MAWAFNSLFVQTADGVWNPSRRPVGSDAVAPRAENAQAARLLHAAEPRGAQHQRPRLRFGRHARLHVPQSRPDRVGRQGRHRPSPRREVARRRRSPDGDVLDQGRQRRDVVTRRWACGARPATFVNARNERWVYYPMWGPPSKNAKFERANGDAPRRQHHGVSGRLSTATSRCSSPKWISRNLSVPDSPVIANGVVYAISTGENTLQRHTDPRYHAIFQKPGRAAAAQDRHDDG